MIQEIHQEAKKKQQTKKRKSSTQGKEVEGERPGSGWVDMLGNVWATRRRDFFLVFEDDASIFSASAFEFRQELDTILTHIPQVRTAIHIHTYIHTYIQVRTAYIHTCIHTYIHTYTDERSRKTFLLVFTFQHTYIQDIYSLPYILHTSVPLDMHSFIHKFHIRYTNPNVNDICRIWIYYISDILFPREKKLGG